MCHLPWNKCRSMIIRFIEKFHAFFHSFFTAKKQMRVKSLIAEDKTFYSPYRHNLIRMFEYILKCSIRACSAQYFHWKYAQLQTNILWNVFLLRQTIDIRMYILQSAIHATEADSLFLYLSFYVFIVVSMLCLPFVPHRRHKFKFSRKYLLYAFEIRSLHMEISELFHLKCSAYKWHHWQWNKKKPLPICSLFVLSRVFRACE